MARGQERPTPYSRSWHGRSICTAIHLLQSLELTPSQENAIDSEPSAHVLAARCGGAAAPATGPGCARRAATRGVANHNRAAGFLRACLRIVPRQVPSP